MKPPAPTPPALEGAELERFRLAVDAGLTDIEAGRVVDDEEAFSDLEADYSSLDHG